MLQKFALIRSGSLLESLHHWVAHYRLRQSYSSALVYPIAVRSGVPLYRNLFPSRASWNQTSGHRTTAKAPSGSHWQRQPTARVFDVTSNYLRIAIALWLPVYEDGIACNFLISTFLLRSRGSRRCLGKPGFLEPNHRAKNRQQVLCQTSCFP